ncbi:MAG: hypothetical protein P8J33_09225 [Pirellulaceae bacterium]|nr:hypothetical protein [Pirellulaceae bacterium]
MKLTSTILAITALGIALVAVWHSYSGKTQWAEEFELLAMQVEEQNRVLVTTQFKLQELQVSLMAWNDRIERSDRELSNNSQNETKIKDHGVTNDKQWQDIDYLKKQRQYHKQLLDNLNQEVISLKRQDRTVKPEDIAELRRRIDELSRLLNRGNRN